MWKDIQKKNIYLGSDIQGTHKNHWTGGYFITQVSQVGNQLKFLIIENQIEKKLSYIITS